MPAKSKEQQQAMAIALHSPKKLYKRNKGLLSMTKKQLREYASTPHSTLPEMPMDIKGRKKMCRGGLVKK